VFKFDVLGVHTVMVTVYTVIQVIIMKELKTDEDYSMTLVGVTGKDYSEKEDSNCCQCHISIMEV